jgi:hypothetical protein
VLAIVLVLANLIRHDVLTWETLKQRKDALDAASSVLGILVLGAGSVLSYFRFFHGRTFSTRGEVDLLVEIHSLPTGQLLHLLSLSFKNVGTTAIWDPQPSISAIASTVDRTEEVQDIGYWMDAFVGSDGRLRAPVIDTGETGRFPAQHTFAPEVVTVTYVVTITCETGDVWRHVRIVRNSVSPVEGAKKE